MEMTCPTCKMKIDTNQHQRCPRCHTILNTMKKCEDCNGCSVFKKSNNSSETCADHN